MNQSANFSETSESPHVMEAQRPEFQVLQVLRDIISLCGMVGNACVIWLLGFRIHRNPFSSYVLNLAVADFLLLLCLFIVSLKFSRLIVDFDFITFCVMIVTLLTYAMGLSLLTVISVQRCLSVLFPIWYKVHRPRHLSTVVCTLLWGLSLLTITLVIYFCSTGFCNYMNMLTTLSIAILGIFTPVMILSSVVLFVQSQRRPRDWHQQSSRLVVIILTSVVMFLVCSLPLGIFWTLMPRLADKNLPKNFDLFLNLTLFTSSLSNSANPFIYFLVGRQKYRGLQQHLRTVLSRALQEDPEFQDTEMPSTNTNEVGSDGQPSVVSAQVSLARD